MAISRALAIYWEQEKSRTVPDHLVQLAAKVEETLG